MSLWIAANTISIIIGAVIGELDCVGDGESGIIGCACTFLKFDHSSMADTIIHPSFMVNGDIF